MTLVDVATHVVQLTDTHALAEGSTTSFGLDTNARLEQAVRRIEGLQPPADVVVISGDLTDGGTDVEFDALLARLAPLQAPVWPVVGNHDERDGLRRAFPGVDTADAPGSTWQWVSELDEVRIVALDTTIEGRHDGELDDARLGWLDDRLGEQPGRVTIVAMHHPPFTTGIWWMDAGALRRGADGLRAVVADHPQVRRIICGHHHRSIITSWGATVVSVAPSTAHQVHLDLSPESPARFTTEPGGFHLHVVDGDDVTTHVVTADPPERIVELAGGRDGWERFARRLRSGAPLEK